MNMFFMTLIPITSLYPDAPNSIFPTLEKFGQPQTIIGIFDPKHHYFLLICLLLLLDVEQILFVTLHCDPRYYFYEIFMPYVFKMSIAIH